MLELPAATKWAGDDPARRLLTATDLSPRSDRAVRRAADLARSVGAELLLLYVVNDDQPASLVEAEHREALALLRGRASELAELGHGTTPRILVEAGDAFDGIIRAADAQEADLVVLGAHRQSLLRGTFAGTTAQRVMRYGSRPVLLVNRPPAGPYRRIIAAADLDEASARVLRTAASLGLLYGTDLTVLHAFRVPGRGPLVLGDASAHAIAGQVLARAQEARAALARFLAGLCLNGSSRPRMMAEEGEPATVIKDVAARLRPDLVLMGTGRRDILRRAFLGSVAAEVVPELECDMLVVPPDWSR